LDEKIQMKTHALKAHQESRKMDDSKVWNERDMTCKLSQAV
jgi:hypothetical protein